MDRVAKLKLLTRAAQYDLCAACGTQASRVRDEIGQWLYPAVLPDGKRVTLLKVLQSNLCENNCLYCGNRRARDVERSAFSPEELAAAFDELVRRNRAQGLFLSSAVWDSTSRTMEQMIATVELVRFKYQFRGYIHLKLLPGCEKALVERAVQIADRVSINLEAPNPERLQKLSHDKRYEQDLLQPLQWARQFRNEGLGAKAGLTTQFVVGAASESDLEILETVARLYREYHLTRAYFSAFQPIPDTPLENLPATPPLREHRLYQSDFLLRYYGFSLQDLTFDEKGYLHTDVDPKMAWALRHPEYFPVEINRASKEQLLRVPGIGPRSAARILQARRENKLRCIEDLSALGIVGTRAAPFILLDGRRPPQQLTLW
ncbi:MAG: putative DNA modification/repair radical SAM protein [Anaerolineae bacterium]